jgi:Domain of unknown function (DUF1735)
MKYLSLLKPLTYLSAGILLFSSCKKVGDIEPIGTAGQTIVKFIDPNGTGKSTLGLSLISTPQTIEMVEVVRDVPNETELNRAMTVIVSNDPGAVSVYNAANGTNLVPIPAAQYSVDASSPRVGNDYTLTMQPGEFAKSIKFILPNALSLNLNLAYAFGFTISTVDAGGKITSKPKTMVVELGVKNKWDGVYTVTGTMVDNANATFTGTYPLTFHLITTGGATCSVYDPNLNGGSFGHLFNANGVGSFYGSFMPVVTFDANSNKILSATNYWGQGSGPNVRSCALDPTGINTVAANKDISIKYQLIQAPPAAFVGVRVIFTETWTYVGPR